MASALRNPLTPLLAFAVLMSFFFVAYVANGQEISPAFETIAGMFGAWLLVYWISADTKRLQADSCFDFGFLCAAFFPLSLPWHCFRSRGWRGILTLMLLLAIWIAPYLVAGFAWGIMYGG